MLDIKQSFFLWALILYKALALTSKDKGKNRENETGFEQRRQMGDILSRKINEQTGCMTANKTTGY